MGDRTEEEASAEYRDAMLQGANLMWEDRWEAAAAAYRRALEARPGEPCAKRQLALALTRLGVTDGALEPHSMAPAAVATFGPSRPHEAGYGTGSQALGRTASAHVGELAALPHHLVHRIVEGMRTIEREQAAGHYPAAFESAYTLLQQAPTFLPLHILLADLYTDTGQWQAVREKIEAIEAVYAARSDSAAAKAAA